MVVPVYCTIGPAWTSFSIVLLAGTALERTTRTAAGLALRSTSPKNLPLPRSRRRRRWRTSRRRRRRRCWRRRRTFRKIVAVITFSTPGLRRRPSSVTSGPNPRSRRPRVRFRCRRRPTLARGVARTTSSSSTTTKTPSSNLDQNRERDKKNQT